MAATASAETVRAILVALLIEVQNQFASFEVKSHDAAFSAALHISS
jgi:hypothetical protein